MSPIRRDSASPKPIPRNRKRRRKADNVKDWTLIISSVSILLAALAKELTSHC